MLNRLLARDKPFGYARYVWLLLAIAPVSMWDLVIAMWDGNCLVMQYYSI
jgi:hypothetical protein